MAATTVSLPSGRYSNAPPGLVVPPHDYALLSYTGSDLTSVVYRVGGASGHIVGTLTNTYDGSGNLLTYTLTRP